MYGKHLFDISYKGRNLSVRAYYAGWRRRYLGLINGAVYAIGSSKGEALRRLMEIAQHYPMADTFPPPPPRRKLVRPRKVAPPKNTR